MNLLEPNHSEANAFRDAADDLAARIEERAQELLADPAEFADRIADGDIREFLARLISALYDKPERGSIYQWAEARRLIEDWAQMCARKDVE